ncbi:MAG: uracil-DNA glycosylase [Firmicutes bacterium]|nr:uracil-DNA glycosylase [Bacillota bacterium]MDD7131418.1 uracil-DNA glycosylase [Bacillota bacterium]MDY5606500.1 uracil-DNA glycosylase [Lentihominibacter sp.]MDY6174340.1 uracil-DNA glycosylase [Lentihominibacter sp.]
MVKIGNSWDTVLREEFKKEYYLKLREFLKQEYGQGTVYPDPDNIFNALKLTSYDDAKAVIIGQDPYHEPGQAQGLSFSVPRGMKQPPSLVNIFKEMQADLGIRPPDHGCLEGWAREGVLLLNAVLTVREHQANSHRGKGWENFTDSIIEALNNRQKPLVFILWGNNAKAKAKLITSPRHHIITGAHPSPLSAHNGFWGGRYFSGTNEFLEEQGIEPINWKL